MREPRGSAPKSGKGGRRAVALAGGGAVVAIAWWLRGVIPGWGTDPSPPAPEDARLQVHVEQVVVKGDQCTWQGAVKGCDAVCAAIEPSGEVPVRVEIDGTEGAHGVVDALKRCLEARRIGAVSVGNR